MVNCTVIIVLVEGRGERVVAPAITEWERNRRNQRETTPFLPLFRTIY